MDDVLSEIHIRVQLSKRVLITTLTKRMAEDLTDSCGKIVGEHGSDSHYLSALLAQRH